MWSEQAILMRAAVAGESNLKGPVILASALAAEIAAFMAKNAAAARKRGGSPTA